MLQLLKFRLISIRHKLRLLKTFNKKVWILSRTACLFNDTLVEMDLNDIPRVNIQKGRVDLWLDFLSKQRSKPKFGMIKYIIRHDIKKLFIEQFNFYLEKKNPPYMYVMDSYSELVDRKFFYSDAEKEYFFSYADDLNEKSNTDLENDGLIQSNKIFEIYNSFFEKFREFYPFCPIVFILVPSKLEKRDFFIARSKIIKESISRISKAYDDFHLIEIPEEIIFNNPHDDYPYHYSNEVYKYLSSELRSKRLFKKLYDKSFLK